MAFQILQTKTRIPPVKSSLVSRPRLTAALTGALARPVTVVIAPAGFGKTTLLSEWRETPEGRRWPLAWLALEPSDSEPQRFWTYVAAALRTVPALGRNSEFAVDMLATFMGAPHPTPEQFLTPLINDILATEEPFVLVLDDYHLAAGEPVNAAMAFLLDHLPPAMRVAILTRTEPDLPLGHLRGRGLLSELTGGDLRFSLAESEAFLNGSMGSGLAFDEVRALQERTEGWVAGLQMAALSLRGHQDRREAVASFAGDNRHIADYFIDEVLTKQPSDILEFLRRTAILDRLCGPLCDAVAGVSGSQEILEHLERSNLFLTSMDDERRWYRYHGLLARMLQARLERDQPDLMRELHLRASCWFEEQGFALEAVNHATAAKDYARVADIAERNGPGWWASTTYAGVHMRFPTEVTMQRPTFCLSQGWRYTVQGQLGEASRLYDRAEQLLTASGRSYPDAEAMLRFVALVRKYIAELSGGTYKLTDSDYRATAAIPEESVGMRNSADLVLAFIAQMEGELEKSAEILLSATERELRLHSTITIALAISRLARIRLVQGRLGDAEAALSRHLDTIDALGRRRFYLNGNLHAVMADVLCERNHLVKAMRHADEGIESNEAWGIPHAISMSYHSKARVLAAQGDIDGALSLIDQEEQRSIGRILISDVVSDRQTLRVRLHLAKGDLPSAERWARESGLGPEDELSFRCESRHIALARVMIASGRSSEAVSFLSRLAAAAKKGGRMGRLLEILVLTAVAQAGTDTDEAARTMARALTLAEPEGYVRSFTGEDKQALDLLRLVASMGSAPGRYAQRLLAACAAPQAAAAEVPALPEPLSPREMEILGLLAAGLSNRDIAQTLYLTVGTVKTHVHNLLAKLDVESRTQAIARARDLGLLRE